MDDQLNKSLKFHLEQLTQWGIDFVPRQALSSENDLGVKRTSQSAESLPISPLAPSNPLNSGLGAIRDEIGDCRRCPLCTTRTNIVFGVGDPHAKLLFVGEGPGADEDQQGEPFVGKAGQLLTKMIEAMGLKRSDVYIANVVKCRPPNNRNPEPIEITTCLPFLKRQIDTVNPKVIVALGKFAAQTLLRTEIPITKMRGDFQEYGSSKLMPTYHPAFLLRNPLMKRAAWEDLKKVMKELGLKGTID